MERDILKKATILPTTGHCLCNAITFAYDAPVNWCAHCHCESCRRQTASPFTTFVSVPTERFAWTKGTPAIFSSSPGVTRSFCRDCGTPLAYENDAYPGEIHLYLATLDADATLPSPGRHDFWAERVPWVTVDDRLPKDDGDDRDDAAERGETDRAD